MRSKWALAIAAAAAVAILWLAGPVRQALSQGMVWIEGQGAAGVAFLIVLYFPLALAGMPVSWLTAVAGALYGPWWALLIATAAANPAANLAFFAGRRLGRRRVERWLDAWPRLRRFEAALSAHGFRVTLYARLSPATPYGILSYLCSITRMSQRDFALATLIGKTPGNCFYAFAGAGAHGVLDAASGSMTENKYYYWFLAAGVAVTLILLVTLRRIATKALIEAAARESA
jgi:uncharacterized membrane protein YdjX (TVP38/TMEM64 family)